MPGFMGIRGLDTGDGRSRSRKRQEASRVSSRFNSEQRSMEKVREILRGQEGDMTAFNGEFPSNDHASCHRIALEPLRKIMSTRVAAVSFDDTLLTVQGIFASVRFHHLPVVDADGAVIGILSDRDFLRAVSPFLGTINEQSRDKQLMTRKVGLFMTRQPLCACGNVSILDAARTMNSRKISCLPIVDPETCILEGIVTWKDVVRAFCPQAFNPARESVRIRCGIKLDPPQDEKDMLQRKKASSARSSRSDTVALPKSGHPANPSVEQAGDTRRLSFHAPEVGQQDSLPGSTAGQAGSHLAEVQEDRIREEYGDGDAAD